MLSGTAGAALPVSQIAVTSLELQQTISLQELPVGSRTEVEIKAEKHLVKGDVRHVPRGKKSCSHRLTAHHARV